MRDPTSEVRRFQVIFEGHSGSYSAYVPDLPGCAATGRTTRVVTRRIERAVSLHVGELLRSGEPLPRATAARHADCRGAVRVDLPAVRFESERR